MVPKTRMLPEQPPCGRQKAEQNETEKLAASLAPKKTSRSDEYWPIVLLLLLGVLSAETLLASRVNA